MDQSAFATIKLEGNLDPSDLKDLDEKDLGNTFTNIRCPPPTVTVCIRVPFQGINVFTKSQNHLIITSRAARY